MDKSYYRIQDVFAEAAVVEEELDCLMFVKEEAGEQASEALLLTIMAAVVVQSIPDELSLVHVKIIKMF